MTVVDRIVVQGTAIVSMNNGYTKQKVQVEVWEKIEIVRSKNKTQFKFALYFVSLFSFEQEAKTN
jgi:hypothetical protein